MTKQSFKGFLMTICMSLLFSGAVHADVTYSATAGTNGFDGENYPNLFDGDTHTKWCLSFGSSCYVSFTTSEPIRVDGYTISTANDTQSNPRRNPKNWVLLASTDNTTWDTIHHVVNDNVLQATNYQSYEYRLPVPTEKAYQYFQWKITAIQGSNVMQVSEFSFLFVCEHEGTLVHHDATPATCYTPSYAEYWQCSVCGRMFADEAATRLVTSMEELISGPVVAHNYVDGICTMCGRHEHPMWDTNLITNGTPTAESGTTGWEAVAGAWAIKNGFFASSYNVCKLTQIVDLEQKGFLPEDIVRKQVEMKLRYYNPYDEGGASSQTGICKAEVSFLNSDKQVISTVTLVDHSYTQQREDTTSVAIFDFIPAGTYFIQFILTGKDQNNWRGNYGPGFSDISVVISSSEKTTYAVTINAGEHITATANMMSAPAGATVELLPSPAHGYRWGGYTTTPEVTWINDHVFVMPAEAVSVTPLLDKTTYAITTVSATSYEISTKAAAYAGEKVTVTGKKDAAYELFSITSSPDDLEWITATQFIMPAHDVTLTAHAQLKAIRLATITAPECVSIGLSDNEYPWAPITNDVMADAMPGLMSSNYNISSSVSTSTITITTTEKVRLSFSYYSSSESCCDHMAIRLDDKLLAETQNDVTTGKCTANLEVGAHTLQLSYSKDGSVDEGLDRGLIYNVSIFKVEPHAITCTTSEHITSLKAVPEQAGMGDTVTLLPRTEQGYRVAHYETTPEVTWVSKNSFIMPNEAVQVTAVSEASTYAILDIKTYDFGHNVVVRDGDTLKSGDIINDEDVLDLYFVGKPGIKILDNDRIGAEFRFETSGDTLSTPVPTKYIVIAPTAKYSCPDATTCVISWTPAAMPSYDVLVTDKQVTDFYGVKGVHHVTENSYTATGLTPGNTYYIYLRARSDEFGNSDWSKTTFVAEPKAPDFEGDPDGECMLHFEMHDSDDDGWQGDYYDSYSGIAVYSNDVFLTTVTLLDGWEGVMNLLVKGHVTLRWMQGEYDDECSFTVTNDEGYVLAECKTGQAAEYGSGEVLYSGLPCHAPCASVDNASIVFEVDHYSVTWTSQNAAGYRYYLGQRPELTAAELEKVAKTTAKSSIELSADSSKTYVLYYQPVCADGKGGIWYSQTLIPNEPLRDLDNAPWIPVSLDTTITGYLMEDAYLTLDGYAVFYSLTLKDSTDVEMAVSLSDRLWGDYILEVLDKNNVSVASTERFGLVSLPAGTYKLALLSETLEADYTITLRASRPDLAPDTISVPFFCDSLSMRDARLIHIPVLPPNQLFPVKQYIVTVPDTMQVSFSAIPVSGSEISYSMSTCILWDMKEDKVCGYGMPFSFRQTLSPGREYLLSIMAGSLDEILRVAVTSSFNDFTPITTDSLYTLRITPNDSYVDILGGIVLPGKVMSFTLEEELPVSAFFTYDEEDIVESGMPPMVMLIAKDSLFNNEFHDFYKPMARTDEWDELLSPGTYYVGIVNTTMQAIDCRFIIRTSTVPMDLAFLPADTLTIGKASTLEVGVAHAYADLGEGADVAVAKVTLEKGKNYHFAAGDWEHRMENFAVAVLVADSVMPIMGMGSQTDELGIFYDFIPDSTQTYTFTLFCAGATYSYDTLSYDAWMRIDTAATPFKHFAAMADTVKVPYLETVELTEKLRVRWDGEYDFQMPYSDRTYYTRAGINAYAVKAVVAAGDTLFVECVATDDVDLYIYPFEDSSYDHGYNPIHVDAGAHEAAHAYFVNGLDTAQTVTVIGAYRQVDLQGQLPLSLHLTNSEADLQPVAVTAKANKQYIYVDGKNEAEALEQLVALEISVLDEKGSTLMKVENNPGWWCIDWAAGKAEFELNDTDLPYGYSFYEEQYFVTVEVRVRKVVHATSSLESFIVDELSETAVRSELDKVVVTVADESGKTVLTLDKQSACWSTWSIDLAAKTATLTLTNDVLAEGYRFENGVATVTVSFEVLTGLDTILTEGKAIKRLVDGHLVIITPDGKAFDVTGCRLR